MALAGSRCDGCARRRRRRHKECPPPESDASARTCVTSGWRSLWPLPSPRTIAHSARRRQGPGEKHEMRCTTRQRSGSASPCMHSMFLCRRWWISCRTLSNSFVHSHLILSRLSKCPRSCLSMSPRARPCAFRSWRNSWWKCRRSSPFLVSSLQRTVEQHVDIPVPGGGGSNFWSSRFFLWTEFNSVAFQETHF